MKEDADEDLNMIMRHHIHTMYVIYTHTYMLYNRGRKVLMKT